MIDMKRVINVFKENNIEAAYLYFYVHFITEVICFYVLANLTHNSLILWLVPLIYDSFAFVPQGIIGYLTDKYPKINIGIIGVLLLTLGFILFFVNLSFNPYLSIIILCLGNACIHVSGASVTLRCSEGKMAHSAIFVSGGSFGVITGKLLASNFFPKSVLTLISLSMIPFILLASFSVNESSNCSNYNYHNKNFNPFWLIILVVLVVIIRGFMGYGIPTSWNKAVWQNILFYTSMGIGKALGGILLDAYDIKTVSYLSLLASLPFLLFGDQIMLISLIGIMFFSMTMAITLALLVSVLKKTPCLAFGLTTIGLFLGTVPIFFIKFTNLYLNAFIIIILTIVCFIILNKVIRKEKDERVF